MAATRLRKTFRYPSEEDEDNDISLDGMDEQEQEELIHALHAQDTSTNKLYIQAFTVLPLLLLPTFVYRLFTSIPSSVRLLCLLSMTSLVATAFLMWFVPLSTKTPGYKRATRHEAIVRKIPGLDVELDEDGPLVIALPYLNLGICGVLCLASLALRARSDVPPGMWIMLFLPALVLGVVLLARQSMRDVQQGIGELDKLKYDYKGA